MRILISLLLVITANRIYAHSPAISEVRVLYKGAASNSISCSTLLSLLDLFNENNNPLLAGYKACATMIMATYVINPFKKLSIFKQGKLLLEGSIAKDKKNIELRFLRFSVQTEAPQFLGYNKAMQEDKSFIIKNFAGLTDLQLKQLIISFLRTSTYLSTAEKQIVNR